MKEQRLREIIREEIKAAMPCTCQYGRNTPDWYISVKTCLRHHERYRADATPDWWDPASNEPAIVRLQDGRLVFEHGVDKS